MKGGKYETTKDYYEIIEQPRMDKLCQIYDSLVKQIELLQNDKEIDQVDLHGTEELILNIYPYLISLCILKPLSEEIKLFIMSFNQIIYNWNINSLNNRNISETSVSITNLLNDYLSMLEMIKIMRFLVDHVNRISSWLPPSLDVSKQYYQLIENQLKKDRDCIGE